MFTALVFFQRKMIQIGYPKKRVFWYILISGAAAFPLGYISSRAGGILYRPLKYWSLAELYKQVVSGTLHTFHASLVLPVIMFLAFAALFRFSRWHVLDTGFLYMPLAHAIGRLGCLCAGCCWGHKLSFTLFNSHFAFKNPVPIYASLANLAIFFVLRRVHAQIYTPDAVSESGGRTAAGPPGFFERMSGTIFKPFGFIRNKGGVTGGYLMLYGIARFLLEIIRTNRVAAFGLTWPQLTMIVFAAAGSLILLATQRRRPDSEPLKVRS
jgi:phosphatidylglycerol:prolipoprotein diacylglycerol transferase